MSVAYLLRLVERLWAYTEIRGENECWLWQGPMLRPHYYPYGDMKFKHNGKHVSTPAHRFMWMVEHPAEPLPESVCHSCDNTLCVNPAHLFAGTQIDNIRDCIAKGRNARGQMMPQARLTAEDVRAIRADKRPHAEIERDYGLSRKYVGAIKRRVWWSWLP